MDKNKRCSWIFAPVRALIIKVVLVVVAVVAIVLVARHYINKVASTSTPAVITKNEKIDITPSQIRSIEQIGEWSFLEINDEEMVDTVRHGFFSDDKLVRIYYGTLRLGINMKEAHEGWLAIEDDTLRAILPPIRLLDNNFIDEARTKSFFEKGEWKLLVEFSIDDKKAYFEQRIVFDDNPNSEKSAKQKPKRPRDYAINHNLA